MASYCKSEMLSIAISLSQKAKVNKSQFIPGPSFTKLFGRSKFINAMKRHSTANLYYQFTSYTVLCH